MYKEMASAGGGITQQPAKPSDKIKVISFFIKALYFINEAPCIK